MVNRLPSLGTRVGNHTKTFGEARFGGDPLDSQQEMSRQILVLTVQIRDGTYFLFRNHQQVDRRLGSNIMKRQAAVILLDNLRRNFTINDLLEYGFFVHPLIPPDIGRWFRKFPGDQWGSYTRASGREFRCAPG